MLFKPSAHAPYGTLVRVRRRVWPMEDANFLEEDDSHATTFALADFPAKAFER